MQTEPTWKRKWQVYKMAFKKPIDDVCWIIEKAEEQPQEVNMDAEY